MHYLHTTQQHNNNTIQQQLKHTCLQIKPGLIIIIALGKRSGKGQRVGDSCLEMLMKALVYGNSCDEGSNGDGDGVGVGVSV